MQINSGNVVPKNRNAVILVIILAVVIIILLGILYFTKQKNLGEGTPGITGKNAPKTHTISELRQLTSAPENNPDIKPNAALTALTSASEKNLSAKADSQVIGNLTAPKN